MLFLIAVLSFLNFFVNTQYSKVYFGSDGFTQDAFNASTFEEAEKSCKNFRIPARLAVLETERDKYYIEHAATLWRYTGKLWLKRRKLRNTFKNVF